LALENNSGGRGGCQTVVVRIERKRLGTVFSSVTKGKNLCVEVGTVLKGEVTRAKNATKNNVHGGSEHGPHKDHNLCVSSSGEVFRKLQVPDQ
jgi:hypothetical protein